MSAFLVAAKTQPVHRSMTYRSIRISAQANLATSVVSFLSTAVVTRTATISVGTPYRTVSAQIKGEFPANATHATSLRIFEMAHAT